MRSSDKRRCGPRKSLYSDTSPTGEFTSLLTIDSNTILRAKSALTDTVKQEQFIVEWRDSITIIGNEMGVDYGHLKVTIS